MDYKYIEQLLERYWRCETSLEEEKILRTFFAQKDVPATLMPYRELFVYEQDEHKEDVLGEDFDQRIMQLIDEPAPKAKIVSMRRRLLPLFRAAAVVAIIVTIGNAIQMAFDAQPQTETPSIANMQKPYEGVSVANADTVKIDSMKLHSNIIK
jgi:hypothetical protein